MSPMEHRNSKGNNYLSPFASEDRLGTNKKYRVLLGGEVLRIDQGNNIAHNRIQLKILRCIYFRDAHGL